MNASDLVANVLAWSLQAGAIAGVASVLPALFRLDVAGVRYAYWRGIACLCLALPWIQPYRAGHLSATTETVSFGRVAAESASPPAASLQQGDWAVIVLVVLAIGVAGRFVWLACGLLKLRRLRRSAAVLECGRLDDDLQPTLPIAADVRYSPDLEQPVTFGLTNRSCFFPRLCADKRRTFSVRSSATRCCTSSVATGPG